MAEVTLGLLSLGFKIFSFLLGLLELVTCAEEKSAPAKTIQKSSCLENGMCGEKMLAGLASPATSTQATET